MTYDKGTYIAIGWFLGVASGALAILIGFALSFI